MKHLTTRLAPALGCVLLSVISASAATITSFTASYANNANYSTTPLTAAFSGATARVTSTSVTCLTAACSLMNPILSFSLTGIGLDPTQSIILAIDGNLSGSSAATGGVTLMAGGIPIPIAPFSIAAGDFNTTILSTRLPITGAFAFSGTLGLTMAAGQTLTLPSSFTFSAGAPAASAPEPGTIALLGTGLTGLVFLVKRRKSNPVK